MTTTDFAPPIHVEIGATAYRPKQEKTHLKSRRWIFARLNWSVNQSVGTCYLCVVSYVIKTISHSRLGDDTSALRRPTHDVWYWIPDEFARKTNMALLDRRPSWRVNEIFRETCLRSKTVCNTIVSPSLDEHTACNDWFYRRRIGNPNGLRTSCSVSLFRRIRCLKRSRIGRRRPKTSRFSEKLSLYEFLFHSKSRCFFSRKTYNVRRTFPKWRRFSFFVFRVN